MSDLLTLIVLSIDKKQPQKQKTLNVWLLNYFLIQVLLDLVSPFQCQSGNSVCDRRGSPTGEAKQKELFANTCSERSSQPSLSLGLWGEETWAEINWIFLFRVLFRMSQVPFKCVEEKLYLMGSSSTTVRNNALIQQL